MFIKEIIQNYLKDTKMQYDDILKNPKWQNSDGNTLAMFFVLNSKIPPKELHHSHTIKNNHGETVAMLLAQKGFIRETLQWQHGPLEKDNQGMTVAMWICTWQQLPPDYWMHSIELTNNQGKTMANLWLQQPRNLPKVLYFHDDSIHAQLKMWNVKVDID